MISDREGRSAHAELVRKLEKMGKLGRGRRKPYERMLEKLEEEIKAEVEASLPTGEEVRISALSDCEQST